MGRGMIFSCKYNNRTNLLILAYTIFLLRFVGWGGKGGRSSDEILEEILTLKEDQQLFQASMTTRKDQTSDMWEAEGVRDDFTDIGDVDASDDGDDCNSDDADDGSNDCDDGDHSQQYSRCKLLEMSQ